ncbi:MAG: DNA translocase FtsK 4TM domain-containing protein, partial [Actinomycetota bacterium]
MATKTKARRGRARKRPGKRARTPVRTHLAPWARDALGIGLVVFALLSVLALWLDSAGVAGRGIAVALHGAVGAAAMVFPVLALYWGVVLLKGAAEDARARMLIGFTFALIGVLGILSLLRDNPSPSAGYAAVEDAAGVIGSGAAWPLSRAISSLGAGIVCAGLAALGLLIFTGTPLATALAKV